MSTFSRISVEIVISNSGLFLRKLDNYVEKSNINTFFSFVVKMSFCFLILFADYSCIISYMSV